jgi:DNA-binding transcriptional LysR family regulator
MASTLEDIAAMVTFATVVDSRSFTAAATKLGLSKSAVSQRISQLEQQLGVQLLTRTTRRLAPTVEGTRFYEHCARLTQEVATARNAFEGVPKSPKGTLRVNAPVAFAHRHLAAPIEGFLRAYPEVQMEISLTDRFVDPLEEAVDVVLRIRTKLPDSSLMAKKLATGRLLLVGAPAYLATHGTPQTPEDLAQHNCLGYSLIKSHDEWSFTRDGERHAVSVHGSLIANDGAFLREAVIAGVGLAMLPEFMVDQELRSGALVALLDAFTLGQFTVFAMFVDQKHLAPKVRAFIDYLAAHFATVSWTRSA